MALTLINKASRTVGFSGEITTAANPTLALAGNFAGANAVRFKLTPGLWHLKAQFEGTDQFRLFDGNGREAVPFTTDMDTVLNVTTTTEFYFAVANWTLHKGKKLHVVLTQAPPLRKCKVLGWWSKWR